MLDVFVPKVVLQGAGIMAIIGELKPAGVPKHMRVDREWHFGGLAKALDEPVEAHGTGLARRASETNT